MKPVTPQPQAGDDFDLSYTVDADDVIVSIAGRWDEFALANNGGGAAMRCVLGKRLDDFIVGDATRMFSRAMLMSARTLREPLHRAYRCDSPDRRRYMEMLLLPGEERCVEVRHRLLTTEPIRTRVGIEAASRPPPEPAGKPLPQGYAKRCSLCNRVQLGAAWRELDEAAEGGWIADGDRLRVIYGVCPSCLARPAFTPRRPA